MSHSLNNNNVSPSTFIKMFEGTAFYDMLKDALPEEEFLKLTGGIYSSKGNLRINSCPAVQKALQTVLNDEIVANLKEEKEEQEAEAENVAQSEEIAAIAAKVAEVASAKKSEKAAGKAKKAS